jgi:hypothetical protein
VTQEGGLKLSHNKNEQNNFSSLLLRKALNEEQFRVGKINEVPFDYCCPSISSMISSRSCNCGLYFGTKKCLQQHQKVCQKTSRLPKSSKDSFKIIRPQRLAAKRQGEKMVVWVSCLNGQHVDWFDDFDSDIENISDIDDDSINAMPIIDLDKYMKDPFDDGDDNE